MRNAPNSPSICWAPPVRLPQHCVRRSLLHWVRLEARGTPPCTCCPRHSKTALMPAAWTAARPAFFTAPVPRAQQSGNSTYRGEAGAHPRKTATGAARACWAARWRGRSGYHSSGRPKAPAFMDSWEPTPPPSTHLGTGTLCGWPTAVCANLRLALGCCASQTNARPGPRPCRRQQPDE